MYQRMRKTETKRQKGFTLVELLMAMAMTAIMISVVMVSLSGSKTNRDVDGEAAKILAALREVQNYSLTGKGIGGTRACGSFSVKVLDGNIVVYYSDRTSGTCTPVGSPLTYVTGNGVTLTASLATDATLDFAIPNGKVTTTASGTSAELTADSVEFQLEKNGVYENVCVYPFGRIEQKAIGTPC